MAASSATAPSGRRAGLRRDRGRGVLGGVCAGIARTLAVDPLPVRVAFVAAALAGGLGVALYLLAWVAIPADEGASAATVGRPRRGRGSAEVALGAALLLLSALLAMRELGVWFSDALVWPLVLAAAGGALLWRESAVGRPAPRGAEPSAGRPERRAGRPDGSWPGSSLGGPGKAEQSAAGPAAGRSAVRGLGRLLDGASAGSAASEGIRDRAALVSRTGLGVALVIAAGLVFLQATGSLTAARDVVLAVLVVVVVLGVIFAPWIVRLARSLAAERAERVRSQERAELAAHLHDSVLQTLALVQKRADRPREVAALARRQERELRGWLTGRREERPAERRLAAALETAAEEVEAAHGVPVEVVAVGDRPLDAAGEALVAAAREAILNAAKFAGGGPIAVYLEASERGAQAFVRDRGPGFDPSSVPPDRRGVRESIVGRMERHGGRARIASTTGHGTEVELAIEPRTP